MDNNFSRIIKRNIKIIIDIICLNLLIAGIYYKISFINNGNYSALIFYFTPVVFIFIYFINIKINEFEKFTFLYKLDIIVIFLSAVRAINDLMFLLPYSGHMLFLLYSIVTVKNLKYRTLVIIMLISTTYFKVFVWHDYFTWISGMILSMPFIALYLLNEKPQEK